MTEIEQALELQALRLQDTLEDPIRYRRNWSAPETPPVKRGLISVKEIRDIHIQEMDITIRFLKERLKSLRE